MPARSGGEKPARAADGGVETTVENPAVRTHNEDHDPTVHRPKMTVTPDGAFIRGVPGGGSLVR